MPTIVEYDGEEDDATSKAQPKKCENPTSNTDTTNDNTCNSSTSASRNTDNGKVTNTETKLVNNEGNKGEGSETEAKVHHGIGNFSCFVMVIVLVDAFIDHSV